MILVHVANDVRQLKGKAQLFRQVQGTRVAEAKHVRAGESNRAGYTIAIFAEAVEGRVRLHRQIHLCAADQVVKIARGHFVTVHGVHEHGQDFGSAAQGRHRRGHRSVAIEKSFLPGDSLIESGAPPRKTALLCREVRAFVRNVVHKAHEGVESSQAIALRPWQEEEGVIEVAVGGAGDAVAFFVRFRQVHLVRGRSMLRPYNCRRWRFLNRDRICVYQVFYQRAA